MPPDPRILAFDTSAAHCAAALLIDGRIVASRYEEMARGQAERLLPLLEAVLGDEGACWEELDAIGVGVGPGNFTGIRIAVAAARGLSLSLGIPALGISSFEVKASDPIWHHSERIDLPGPRGIAYSQDFADGVPISEPQIVPPDVDGGVIYSEAVNWDIDGASLLARLAAARLASGGPFPRPAPLYIRPADAAPPREAPPRILP